MGSCLRYLAKPLYIKRDCNAFRHISKHYLDLGCWQSNTAETIPAGIDQMGYR